MSRSIRSRLTKVENRPSARHEFSAMTDEQLLALLKREVDRDGGIEVVADKLRQDGEEEEAVEYEQLYRCQTAEEFMRLR